MLTINELLADDRYKQYFVTVPKMPAAPRIHPPWRVYVQLEAHGAWRKKDFFDYKDAVRFFVKLRKSQGLHDASITCRPIAWDPPSRIVKIKGKFIKTSRGELVQATKEVFWKPTLPDDEEQHLWCPYCRRPTVFRAFSTHHAMTGEYRAMMDQFASRCTICGIRQEGLGRWARQ